MAGERAQNCHCIAPVEGGSSTTTTTTSTGHHWALAWPRAAKARAWPWLKAQHVSFDGEIGSTDLGAVFEIR